MDIEKLIDRLGENTDCWTDKVHGYADLRLDAATALSTLQAENENLRNEVERQRRSADDRKHLYENAERAYMKVVAELEQVKQKYSEAQETICTHCMDVPCRGESCYWWCEPQKED